MRRDLRLVVAERVEIEVKTEIEAGGLTQMFGGSDTVRRIRLV